MREKQPFSTVQMSQVRHFKDAEEVGDWIDSLTEVHEDGDNQDPYYLHVDHFVVLPFPEHASGILALTVYRRVYLNRGE